MRWEYMVIFSFFEYRDGADPMKITERLNILGDKGWELVNFVLENGSHEKYIFKRPK